MMGGRTNHWGRISLRFVSLKTLKEEALTDWVMISRLGMKTLNLFTTG